MPRIISLGTFTTADEAGWVIRSFRFLHAISQGDWVSTFQTFHPGVITMWLSSLFMAFFSKVSLIEVEQFFLYDLTESIADVSGLFFIAVLPVALVTSLGVILLYFLVGRIFNNRIAILSALLVALDPFYIAHSRVIHLDALVSTFMTLSVLTLLIYLNNPVKKSYIIFSGTFAGLAFLTKIPSIFLILFSIFAIVVWRLFEICSFKKTRDSSVAIKKGNIENLIKLIFIFGGISFVTFFMLWPSMWAEPINTINRLFGEITQHVDLPSSTHPQNFFMGAITEHVGLLYYPMVLLFRSTPLTLIFSCFSIAYLLTNLSRNGLTRINRNSLILFSYIVFFTILMSLFEIKGDRYLLPVFPILDILAAIGLYQFLNIVLGPLHSGAIKSHHLDKTNSKKAILPVTIIIVILLQTSSLVSLHPYYLSYYNPVFGGPQKGVHVLDVGWGEGMDKAAKYLNNKQDAENLTVAVEYFEGFQPFFKGKTIRMYNLNDFRADYLVFYISTRQRNYNPVLWQEYQNKAPEHVAQINSINYAWVYKVDAAGVS